MKKTEDIISKEIEEAKQQNFRTWRFDEMGQHEADSVRLAKTIIQNLMEENKSLEGERNEYDNDTIELEKKIKSLEDAKKLMFTAKEVDQMVKKSLAKLQENWCRECECVDKLKGQLAKSQAESKDFTEIFNERGKIIQELLTEKAVWEAEKAKSLTLEEAGEIIEEIERKDEHNLADNKDIHIRGFLIETFKKKGGVK